MATFHAEVSRTLAAVGVDPSPIADARPFDLPDADRRFADDTEHAAYDPAAVYRYWQVLAQVNVVLEEFAARFSGKTSPVHHFWHTFDVALTRFADVVVDQSATPDPVTREAYSREVVSSGFWFGDPTFPEPAFYSYTAPEPAGLADAALPAAGQLARAQRRPPGGPAVRRRPRRDRTPRPRCSTSWRRPTARERGARAGTSTSSPPWTASPTR